ncbi:hypothetical protein SELMODRAFT_441284 [Selaginella moellendorffii]|uniref:Uncharacterized protein n=1 Tax=Selaginella moellendorffii TaxID=88036 RepID=D8RI89_SELML|nr:hypothetical protein SELMODRAFT_441284 [Selaginella moellendorffii]
MGAGLSDAVNKDHPLEHDTGRDWLKEVTRRVSKRKSVCDAAKLHQLGLFFDTDLQLQNLAGDQDKLLLGATTDKQDLAAHEVVSAAVVAYIQELLLESYDMTLKTLELKRNTSRQTSTIFVSSNVKSAKAIVLLLCDGLWSNKIHVKYWHFLVMHEFSNSSSYIFQSEWAHGLGMAVVVLNPSEQAASADISLEHVLCGWDFVYTTFPGTVLAVVAHGSGGKLALDLLSRRHVVLPEDWEAVQRLRCFAFCNSEIPSDSLQVLSRRQLNFLESNCTNWVSEDKLATERSPIKQVPSGAKTHEKAVEFAFNPMCNFLLANLKDARNEIHLKKTSKRLIAIVDHIAVDKKPVPGGTVGYARCAHYEKAGSFAVYSIFMSNVEQQAVLRRSATEIFSRPFIQIETLSSLIGHTALHHQSGFYLSTCVWRLLLGHEYTYWYLVLDGVSRQANGKNDNGRPSEQDNDESFDGTKTIYSRNYIEVLKNIRTRVLLKLSLAPPFISKTERGVLQVDSSKISYPGKSDFISKTAHDIAAVALLVMDAGCLHDMVLKVRFKGMLLIEHDFKLQRGRNKADGRVSGTMVIQLPVHKSNGSIEVSHPGRSRSINISTPYPTWVCAVFLTGVDVRITYTKGSHIFLVFDIEGYNTMNVENTVGKISLALPQVQRVLEHGAWASWHRLLIVAITTRRAVKGLEGLEGHNRIIVSLLKKCGYEVHLCTVKKEVDGYSISKWITKDKYGKWYFGERM